MEGSEQEKELLESFRKFIKPYLKTATGLRLEKGFSSRGLEIDYVIKDCEGNITHLFEVKRFFMPGALKQVERYKAYSIIGHKEKPVLSILACYNEGNWALYGEHGVLIPVKDLFESALPSEKNSTGIFWEFYLVALILFLLCLADYLSPLFSQGSHCSSILTLSGNDVILLCVAGLFCILPHILPRLKEFHLGQAYLVLYPAEKE